MSKNITDNFPQNIYNLCSQIPKGKISTYKLIAQFFYNSPSYSRMVGKVLSRCYKCKPTFDTQNYHCDEVHCYRVIRSDFSLGGFVDNFGKNQTETKRKKLASEGVFFDKKGRLVKELRKKVIFLFAQNSKK
ncbi:MGMT family protein [endosymbiont GvMRE of Glomus versiforme]|uniref:MGMT family protein n=1 Tax=endosymbiont GvMRE of Glomus versiforme TaxID=2039283 RepID=UPI000ED679EB|nr:MGMT family protein [endosymbiont GvMRE of Glomus versiforme]RHZ35704.1 Methylated-DNA-[protein]-cysteine S-methyltransferase [endosymbiont GvMRE of Glomus versiforme]